MAKRIILLILSIIFIVSGLVFVGIVFIEKFSQRNHIISAAVVTEVKERSEKNKTVYDTTYEYRNNNETYTGEIIGGKEVPWVGTKFEIKYDPRHPENHTNNARNFADEFIITLIITVWLISSGIFVLTAAHKSKNTVSKASEAKNKTDS